MTPIQSTILRAALAGCLAWGMAWGAKAQISLGGTPPSFRYEQTLRSRAAAEKVAVNFSIADEKLVGSWRESEGLAPRCVSRLIDVQMTPQNAGAWTTLPDGQTIWQLEIEAEGAQALMLYYADFLIPEGGRLYLYNHDKSELLGAYTHATNPDGGRFATGFISGDAITLEYAPGPDGRQPRLEIEAVGYGYNLPEGDRTWRQGAQLRRTAASCEVNVNCSEGDSWQNEKRGVCQMVQRINDRGYVCTGALMNNTAQDLKPYILTATHCGQDATGVKATDEELRQWQFIFHKAYSTCRSDGQTTPTRSMVGCTRLASTPTHGGSDGLLLLLRQSIPEDYNVYYNGWDRSEQASAWGISLHHPQGDYMKISTYTRPLTSATFYGEGSLEGAPNAHWNAVFAQTDNGHGVTEVGSSGAPLFNSSHRIVGSLTGGTSACTKPEGDNLYGKLSYHWNKQAGTDTHFDRFLDPTNSGVEVLDGRYHRSASAPSGLKAVMDNGRVRLTWTAPTSGAPRTYYIYRNQTKIGESTTTSYIDATPGQGTLAYAVTAVYASGNESNGSTTLLEQVALKAPTNVKVTRTTNGRAAVLWEAPVYEQSIYWGGSRAHYQVNVNNTGESRPFYFGQRWEPTDIAPLNLRTITAVRFSPTRGNTYEVYISQGRRVYRQAITQAFTYGVTNTVTLTTPFTIDGAEALTVAIYVAHLTADATNFPAVCDEGPAIDGKGDLYSFDGHAWERLHTGKDAAKFNYNFFLSAVVSSRRGVLEECGTNADCRRAQVLLPSDVTPHLRSARVEDVSERAALRSMQPYAFPEVTGYVIYRDRAKLATVGTTPMRYTDPSTLTRTVNYQVAAVYGRSESEPSAVVSFTPTANAEVDAAEPAIYPNPFGDHLTLRAADRVSQIEIFGADGRLLLKQDRPGTTVDTHTLPAGVCLIRLTLNDNSQRTLRGLKH